MKKTFLLFPLLFACTPLSMATDTANLLYGFNFEKAANEAPMNVATNPGGTSVTKGGGWFNWQADTMDGSSYSHRPNTGYMELSNSSGLGVNSTEGFSIALNLKYTSSNDWKTFITFGIEDFKYQIGWGDNSIHIFKQNESGTGIDGKSILALTNLSKDTWYSGIITITGDLCEFSLMDINGNVYSQSVDGLQTGNLTYLASGARIAGTQNGDEGVLIDNLGVYDVALSSENLTQLVGKNIADVQTISLNVPEPATASLSLLALGAIALRRRRK